MHPIRSIKDLLLKYGQNYEWAENASFDLCFVWFNIQECSLCLGKKFCTWTGLSSNIFSLWMLNRNSNFQKQVLWWWICLLDSSGGAFHQVWSPCSWWELRKRKVKPKIITTYDSVSVTSFQCNHLLPRDWNVDLIPKFLMANGQLVKLLVHTGVPLTHHANSRTSTKFQSATTLFTIGITDY